MISIRIYIRVFFTVTYVFFSINLLSAQTTPQKFNRDSATKITLIEFNNRVDKALLLLRTKELIEISDTDHINIMMCLNTIFMTILKEHGPKIASSEDGDIHIQVFETKRRFIGGRYDELDEIGDKKYVGNIIQVYPKWIPNRGMGFYFPKLKMELYGTPNLYAIFEVSEL